MLDESAVKALTKAEAVTATATAIQNALLIGRSVAAVPGDFDVKDFESYQPTRRRARGTMSTSVLSDFASYAKANAEAGAAVFIDKDRMKAAAVLNLGTSERPGHADNLAVITLEKSAAFTALLQIANGQPRKQTDVAEFLEDWAPFITCRTDEDVVGTGQAAAAVRNITIEAAKKVTSSEQQLGATKSAFESVQASSADKLPTHIDFLCESPYFGLQGRTISLRLSVLATDKPSIVLRVVKLEEHQESMASEFAELAREALGDMPVGIGTYQRG